MTNPFAEGIPVARPPHDPAPREHVAAAVVSEWPIGTFVENLVVLDDDSALVSIVSSSAIERVRLKDGSRTLFAEFPKEPTGIVRLGDRLFINVGTPGQPGWSIWVSDLQGSISEFVKVPDALFLNGNAQLTEGSLISVDSIRGEVFRVDIDTGQVTSWLQHELLTKNSPEPMMPGVNGVKVVGGHVFFTSTERALVLRCPLRGGQPGEVEVLAKAFVGDDFAVDTEGNLYITTHVYNQVQRLAPDGARTELAGPEQHVHGSTSCAFESPGNLLVTTTGGILAPLDGEVRTAKLVRLTVGKLPAKLGDA
ncbi:MAG: hypothetical protein AAGE52_38275 [Myxococcota bacterium]